MGWPRVNNSLGCSLLNQSVLGWQEELPYLTRHWQTHSGEHTLERLVINVSTTEPFLMAHCTAEHPHCWTMNCWWMLSQTKRTHEA